MDSTTWERMAMMRMMTMKRTPLHPPAHAPAAVPKEIIEEEAPVENGPQELDDLDDLNDLDDDPNEGRSDMDEWFTYDGSND
jgi:hypothetical protein